MLVPIRTKSPYSNGHGHIILGLNIHMLIFADTIHEYSQKLIADA